MATSSFFISYTAADDAWAQWIAWQLEAAGYTARIQARRRSASVRAYTRRKHRQKFEIGLATVQVRNPCGCAA
jgi:hypothetical protein